ncbi:hypothetical protein BD410DRAFT_766014 [Rickenella mellea]|uniref:SET domain-containing protein n=1 Tax=Rickenella mellea TaxID=50990 RepID=A0A4Y7QDQ7_9AGAM|nr:hypothetical protein BD410DRAFT_766014 [Rickenella mellea]
MSYPLDSSVLAEMMSSMGMSSQNPNSLAKMASRFNRPAGTKSTSADDFTAQIRLFKERAAKDSALPPVKVDPTPREEILLTFRPEAYDESGGVRTTYVGMKQSYSRLPLEDLKQINISQMWVRKRHEGYFLLCRVITQPFRNVAIGFGVEDVEGNAAAVYVYNFPTLTYATSADMDAIFSMGTMLAIREPTYKLSAWGSDPMLRVDSPSDLVFLGSDNSIIHGQSWESGATIGRSLTPHKSAKAWRESGAAHFKAKRWFAAAVCFTNGIELDPNEHILRLNRSEVYMRMAWYRSAFQDAEKVLLAVGDNIEDLFFRSAISRAAKSLYYLGEYSNAIEMASRRPQDQECQKWCIKASDRLREQASGEYDWNSIFQESQTASAQLEIAEFTGPLQVRDMKNVGGGRGVFVSKDVNAGELLMVSKAIATGTENRQQNESTMFINCITNRALTTKDAALRSQLIERLWEESPVDLIIKALYAGPDCSPPAPYPPSQSLENLKLLENPLQPSTDIDIMRVDGACSFNCFGLDSLKPINTGSIDENDPQLDRSSGMFSLPSMCNHSCLPSAHWVSFGNFMCVRASRNLQKDEEVTIQYFPGHLPFGMRKQMALSNWGFKCRCILCELDKEDGEKLCREREDAMSRTRQDIGVRYDGGVMRRALKLVEDVRRTYSDHEKRGQCNVKPALFNAHHHLARVYGERALMEGTQFRQSSIEEEMKAVEALGVVILDRGLSGKIKRNSSLPIDMTQGPTHMNDECVIAVLHIVQQLYALDKLRRAELWLKTALYLEGVRVGGGWHLFQTRYCVILEELGLTDFTRDILIPSEPTN